MNVDLHTHTYPASDCSRIAYRDYIGWCIANGVEAVALTNHGDVEDNRKLEGALAAEGVLLLHGTEISTLYGDFVVFSPDLDYLAGFRALQDLPHAEDLDEDAAIVWVHPGAGGGRSHSTYFSGIERMVAHVVDANQKTFLAARPPQAEVAIVYNPLSHFVGGRQRRLSLRPPRR